MELFPVLDVVIHVSSDISRGQKKFITSAYYFFSFTKFPALGYDKSLQLQFYYKNIELEHFHLKGQLPFF